MRKERTILACFSALDPGLAGSCLARVGVDPAAALAEADPDTVCHALGQLVANRDNVTLSTLLPCLSLRPEMPLPLARLSVRAAHTFQNNSIDTVGQLSMMSCCKKMGSSRYASNHLPAMFNNFLERYRGWTSALLEVARAYNQEQLLSRESTTKKIQRNLDEHHPDFRLQYRAMLDVVFPKSALSRLSGSPSYQYASQPASGRQPT